VGIMSVVTDMGRNVEDEREPTWDEAVATLEVATPVEVVRSPREVTVVYRYADGIFTAASPDVRGFQTTGRSLHETRSLVRQDLSQFLDPAVKVLERFPVPDPEICTSAAGCGLLQGASLPGLIVLSSSGTARTFVSSARPSLRRVPAS
jgi:predicted RNase H-like HicB family nuclease